MPIKAIRLKSNPNAIKARVGRDAAVDNRAGRIVLRVCMPHSRCCAQGATTATRSVKPPSRDGLAYQQLAQIAGGHSRRSEAPKQIMLQMILITTTLGLTLVAAIIVVFEVVAALERRRLR
ncbi:hypothetical protein [Bradyrhizobium japonicum]|uniref:hypothetical protein n=1 Tax=Bradyrhizobium japonicum TaxID=375 RepID=UPI0020A03642|nr:hypothetical protein [Bradyrhizobium japonicum]MCP1761012.1 hypothetical protein [Bradyrhizobium japonicum]MCP1792591.1 hypothetical protein [Bradyrhizobium japonicum]MCP1805026.1 hypothetical protein [Bradyrhizobium japonicum]MCP1814047.1 hypothetical protein [Bradyrhizobium japonicum]MCP1874531.1 hypothetical protein [Bradyrhizobium japonicum]